MDKCNNKKRKKGFSKIIVRQRKGTFLAKKCCVNVRKDMPKGKTEEGVIMQINANNLYQRKFSETPLCDRVRSDKQDGDKGRGMRRRWSP
jgi:hypothetical protein